MPNTFPIKVNDKYYKLGSSLINLNRYEEAIKMYNQAI